MGVVVGKRSQTPRAVSAVGTLYLEDVGAVVGQQLGAVGARYVVGEVEDLDVGQGLVYQDRTS